MDGSLLSRRLMQSIGVNWGKHVVDRRERLHEVHMGRIKFQAEDLLQSMGSWASAIYENQKSIKDEDIFEKGGHVAG